MSAARSNPWLTFAGVAAGVFLSTVDGSIIGIALPTLKAEFGVPVSVVQWTVLAYLVTQATVVLLVGRLGDIIGKKRIFTLGFVVFTVFSMGAGLSVNVYMLIGMRVLQAVGGAMVIGLGIALLTEVFPASRRGQILGLIGAVVSIGIVTGPVVGGLILGSLSWRWIFFVNLPVGIVGTFIAVRYIADVRPGGRQRFDVSGAVLLFTATLSLLLALSLGQSTGFGAPSVLGLFAVAAVTTVAFVRLEGRVVDPVVDLTMFKHPDFQAGIVTGLLAFIAVGGLFVVSPFFLVDGLALDPQTTGYVLAFGPLMIGLTAPVAGRVSDRVGPRIVTAVGLGVVAVGFGVLALRIDGHGDVTDFIMGLIPIGAGMGIFQSPNNSGVMGAVPRARFGIAGSMLTLNRILGQSIGIAILTAVWTAGLNAATSTGEPVPLAEANAFRWVAIAALAVVVTALSVAVWALGRRRQAAPVAG